MNKGLALKFVANIKYPIWNSQLQTVHWQDAEMLKRLKFELINTDTSIEHVYATLIWHNFFNE